MQKDFVVLSKLKRFVHEYKRTKFRALVNYPEIHLAISMFDHLKSRMMSADTYISDSDLTLRPSSNLDIRSCTKVDHMNGLRATIGYRFYYNMLLSVWVNIVSKETDFLSSLRMGYGVLIEGLAYLTLETSPNIGVNKRSFLFVLLAFKPLLDALQMDKFD